jgi:hypothetical protein
MKRLPAKPLNEASFYVAGGRDRRKHSEWFKKDPNDPRTMDELHKLPFREFLDAVTSRNYQTEAWLRGEEYPMPYQIRMPEEGDILCDEFSKPFPNDEARIYLAENNNV